MVSVFKEIITGYFKIHKKSINAVCGQSPELSNVKAGDTYMGITHKSLLFYCNVHLQCTSLAHGYHARLMQILLEISFIVYNCKYGTENVFV
jgi:hypothetical protein